MAAARSLVLAQAYAAILLLRWASFQEGRKEEGRRKRGREAGERQCRQTGVNGMLISKPKLRPSSSEVF